MSKPVRQLIYWTPRVIGILIVALFTVVSFDVFVEGYSIGEALLALLIHLIPAAIMAGALAISWRWEWVGGVLFILLSVVYIVAFRGAPIAAYLWISLPLFIAGVLFFVNWRLGVQSKEED
jgi:hypothetical protein